MDAQATVTKSNSLITASYKMTLNEIRLIYSVLVNVDQLKPLDPNVYYTVSAAQWESYFGVTKDICYTEMKSAVSKLYTRDVIINQSLDGEESETTRVIQARKISKGKGTVGIMFANKICKYLSDLRTHFTSLVVDDISKLQSAYHIRIYELLMAEKYKGAKIYFSLDVLIDLLQPPESMKRTDNFQKHIIQEAQKAFKEKLSFSFDYTPIKEGRKIVGFEFNLVENKRAVKKKKTPELSPALEFSSRLEIELFKQLQQVRPAITQKEVLRLAKLEGCSVISMLEFLRKQQELL